MDLYFPECPQLLLREGPQLGDFSANVRNSFSANIRNFFSAAPQLILAVTSLTTPALLSASLAALLPSSLFHIGGDEVQYQCWRTDPRMSAYLNPEESTIGTTAEMSTAELSAAEFLGC